MKLVGEPNSPSPSRLNLVLAVLAVASSLLFASQAAGHVNEDGTWFIWGYTENGDGDRTDPLNVIFKGSDEGDPRSVNMSGMIDDWQGDRGDLSNQSEPGCLSHQFTFYRNPLVRDQNDLNQKSGCYESAWHARAWDSREHDDVHHPAENNPQRDTWAIVGVHYDDCCVDVDNAEVGDNPGLSWERAAIAMKKELDEYCSYSHWRHLPFSGPAKFQKRYSDGILTRISPERISEPDDCG